MLRRALQRLLRKAIGRAPPSAPPRADRPARPTPPRPPAESKPDEPDPEPEVELELEAETLGEWVKAGRDPLVLDIRERHELLGGYAAGSTLIPMNQVPDQLALLPRDRPIVVACAAGVRSFGVAHYLREQGLEDSWSLTGGVGAWLSEGGERALPAQGAPFGLLTPVRLRPEAATARGLEPGERGLKGSIQDCREVDGAYQFALLLGDSGERLEGLSAGELEAVARGGR